ncbi:unnamed protein product [Microthlaspi erraticum]|uniref:Uncharacterized protein n=1 Tax=Microthlaspi erraticum TaxID=1685480 RepID=A0A6D2JJ61_9BRAS|nr:unnamed protein product [Microthlaspi erraticum]
MPLVGLTFPIAVPLSRNLKEVQDLVSDHNVIKDRSSGYKSRLILRDYAIEDWLEWKKLAENPSGPGALSGWVEMIAALSPVGLVSELGAYWFLLRY